MLNPNLTTFLAVADCGSFNRASERLYISPPSVMKQINALEKHLELTLFTRTSQGIQLTAAGQVLYRRTKEPLQALYGPVVPGEPGLPRLQAAHRPL